MVLFFFVFLCKSESNNQNQNIMKLTIKELKEIRNNLDINSESFKKINNIIYLKLSKKKIKKAKKKIKKANEKLKYFSYFFDTEKH